MTVISNCENIKSVIFKARNTLNFLGNEPTVEMYNQYWLKELHSSCDGKDLVGVSNHRSSSVWTTAQNCMITGQDYIHYHALRTNSIPSRVRIARGRHDMNIMCRAGCVMTETVYHTIQQCHRTHGGRILRHDRVVKILHTELKSRGHTPHIEPKLKTSVGLRKPDIISVSGDSAYVVDVQVVRGRGADEAHNEKTKKYQDISGFDELVKRTYGVANVYHHPCTITYKGVWAKDAVGQLKRLGISDHCMFMVVTSVLRGSWLNWKRFNQLTTTGYG